MVTGILVLSLATSFRGSYGTQPAMVMGNLPAPSS
jgi:hypothetical protein